MPPKTPRWFIVFPLKKDGLKPVWLLLSPFIHPPLFRRDEKSGKNNQFVVHLLSRHFPPFLTIIFSRSIFRKRK